MKRKGFLIALAITLSATVYQMVIAQAGTNGDVVYIRSYTPLGGCGGDSTAANNDSVQIVVLNNAALNPDSLPDGIRVEEFVIDPSTFGRGSSYREVDLATFITVQDSIVFTDVAGEPVPLSTPIEVVSNTAAQNATMQLNTIKY
jgi:hypothetical protein